MNKPINFSDAEIMLLRGALSKYVNEVKEERIFALSIMHLRKHAAAIKAIEDMAYFAEQLDDKLRSMKSNN